MVAALGARPPADPIDVEQPVLSDPAAADLYDLGESVDESFGDRTPTVGHHGDDLSDHRPVRGIFTFGQ
ncbi:hypothetical protein AB0C84_35800 [Actinomadura sp. NPDC048955]|uniref:hypothetical protein n=1 Tax=Actinomadura sp. NPDC048955 TaxID=3158228 RepID=UPI0033F9DFDE